MFLLFKSFKMVDKWKKLLLLVVIFLICSEEQIIVSAERGDPLNFNSNRDKRADGDFTDIHSKLTMASRIFSGISIRIQIQNVSGDQLITELINLNESIRLDDVANFSKEKVDEFFGKIIQLQDPKADAVALEKKIGALNSMRMKFEGISNWNETRPFEEYIDKVIAFKAANISFDFLNDLKVADSIYSLQKLMDGSIAQGALTDLRGFLDDIGNSKSKSENLISILKTHEELVNEDILKTEMVKQIELIREYFSNDPLVSLKGDNAVSELTAAFTSILDNNLRSDFGTANPFLKVIKSIVKPKLSIGNAQGVLKLKVDVHDKWLSTVIDNYDTELVKYELKPFEQFEQSLKKLNESWMGFSTTDFENFEIFFGTMKVFESSIQPTDVNLLKSVGAKKQFQQTNDYSLPMQKLVENVRKFRRTLIEIQSRLTILNDLNEMKELESLTEFKKHIDFNNGQTLANVLGKMPAASELQKLVNALGRLHPELSGINEAMTNNNPNSLATEIKQGKDNGEVKKFVEQSNRAEHFKYFEELSGLSLDKVVESSALLKAIRDVKENKNTFIPALQRITSNISNSIQDFNALRAVPASISQTSTKTQELKGIGSHSKVLREAVEVLDTAQIVLNKRKEIEELINGGWNATKIIDALKDTELKNVELKIQWKSFQELSLSLSTLLSSLSSKAIAMNSRRARRQTNTLENYANKLKDLKNLPDIDFDSKPLMKVLSSSQVTIPNGAQMMNTLHFLDKLDLKFSSHNAALNNAGSSVAGIQALFNNFSQVSPTNSSIAQSAPNGLSPKSSGRQATGLSRGKVKNVQEDEGMSFGTGFLIIVVIIVIIGIVLAAMFRRKLLSLCRKSKSSNKSTDSRPKPVSNESSQKPHLDTISKLTSNSLTHSMKTARADSKLSLKLQCRSSKKKRLAAELRDCIQQRMENERLSRPVDQKLEEQIKTLKKELGKLEGYVTKQAKLEYEGHALALRVARLRFETSKMYDDNDLVTQRIATFEKLQMTPLEMCRCNVVWKLENEVYVPPKRPADFCEFAVNQMIRFDVLQMCLETTRTATMILCPYRLRLNDADQLVEDMKMPYKTMKDVPHVKKTRVRCFDQSRVVLKCGKYINATAFNTPYHHPLYVCASPGSSNHRENVNEFIWEIKPNFTISAGTCTRYFHTDCQNQNDAIVYILGPETTLASRVVYEKSKKKDPIPILTHRKVTIFNKTDVHVIEHFEIVEMHKRSGELHKDEEFRAAVRLLMNTVTRKDGKKTVFFDDEGGKLAGCLAGIELIAASLTNDGVVGADVTTQLVKMLERRGQMFTSPDQVIFMVHMAVDRFAKDHGIDPKIDWLLLEKAYSRATDKEMKYAKYGEDKGQKMLAKTEDKTIPTEAPEFERKGVTSAKIFFQEGDLFPNELDDWSVESTQSEDKKKTDELEKKQ